MSTKSRHLERFMPYACDRFGLAIRSVHVALDDRPLGEVASGSILPLDPAARGTLRLSIALERRADLHDLLHPDERDAPPVAIILAVHCRSTLLAQSHPVQLIDPTADKIEHILNLRRDDLHGEITITPNLVRTCQHRRRPGLASARGSWIMKGDPWSVHLDAAKPRQGNNLEILRKRFSEIPGLDPRNWFALQVDGNAPILYLNDEHETLMSALHDTAKRGKKAALREALYDQIAAAVWPALLLHAAQHWRESEGDTYPWQTNVLRLWVKRLRPDERDLDAGVQQLVERAFQDPAGFSLEIGAVLQRDDQVGHLERLLKETLS